jgi:hypothetical protein
LTPQYHVTDGLTELSRSPMNALQSRVWHRVEVKAEGNVFRLLVDGSEVRAFRDDESRLLEGGIAFHLLKNAGLQIRKIEVKELSPPDPPPPQPAENASAWLSLFNDKDLTGLTTLNAGPNDWTVKDGVIVGEATQFASAICTERSDYKDFHIRFEFRRFDGMNSRFVFRRSGERLFYFFETGGEVPKGAILSPWDYGFADRPGGKEQDDLPGTINRDVPAMRDGDWHAVEIIARGNAFRLLVDGKEAARFEDRKSRRTEGKIGVGLLKDARVEIRNVRIKELNAMP